MTVTPSAAPTEPGIDSLEYRRVFGHLPTGVSVVATVESGRAVGLIVGSVFSVSLNPPLAGLCVAHTSTSWPAIERTGRFAINVLADHQQDICRVMSTKDPDKFERVPWSASPVTGSPYVDGAAAHIDCELDTMHLAGDHWIVVGRIRHLAAEAVDPSPMVFCRTTFGRHHPLT